MTPDLFVSWMVVKLAMYEVCTVVTSRTEKSQSLMKSEGYLRHASAWAVRDRRDLVWWDTSWEVAGGTHFGEGNIARVGAMVGYAAIRGNWSTLGGGFTLGSGTTLKSGTTRGGGSGGWPWTGKTVTGRGGDGTESGVGGYRLVDGIQLEKRSRILDMTESCLWWTALGSFVMAHDRKLSAWNMRSERYIVVWVR